MKKWLISLSIIFSTGMAIAGPKTLVFSAIPDQDETQLRKRFNAVAQYLQAELGVPVEYMPVKSYEAVVTAFKNEQVQLAWFGGLTGVHARLEVPGSTVLAQGQEDPTFKTYFIVHSSSQIKPTEAFPKKEMEGLTFTFGAKTSTSGRLMPDYYVRKETGKSPETFFKRVGFSGDHSKTIALVQSGAYQAGAVNYQVWESELKAGKIDLNKVKVIWQTPTYPDYHWVGHKVLDEQWGPGFTEKLKKVIVNIKDPAILAAFPRSGFIEASNQEFEPILKTGKELGLLR